MAGPGSYLIGEEERQELLDVIESGYLFRYGEETDSDFRHKVNSFEEEFGGYIGSRHCVATSSGAGALMAGLFALGVGPGDEVIVPAYTFIASLSSIIFMGARPVLAEIDESLTIDPVDLEKRITPKTKAIMPVHMLGNPCRMDVIMQIARDNNLTVLEDACQAAGAQYQGSKCGSIGDIGAFSLNVFKTITAGDGGALVTDSRDLYERAFGFHDQGHSPLRMGVEIGSRNIVGINLRMNELTGAVALAQCRKIESIVECLRSNKKVLRSYIEGIPGVGFRKINDPKECGTLLTLVFKEKAHADTFAGKIGNKTLEHSGWHVYNNMEQILTRLKLQSHTFPQTDDILGRSVNISVGVVDAGLGAPFGIAINSSSEDIAEKGRQIRRLLEEVVL